MSGETHIFVIDDDRRLRQLLNKYLSDHGYLVSGLEDALHAAKALQLFQPDCLVLDGMMPHKTGTQFARELRAEGCTVPILMLTAMDGSDDRISGLEAGVEDYLTKPFEPRELLLRLKNILKNIPAPVAGQAITIGALKYDLDSDELLNQTGELIALTTAERQLLSCLAQSVNQAVSREVIAKALGGGDDLSRKIDVQLSRLRKKLGDKDAIRTVRGKGYQLNATTAG